jgi:uncharacterized membrane protein
MTMYRKFLLTAVLAAAFVAPAFAATTYYVEINSKGKCTAVSKIAKVDKQAGTATYTSLADAKAAIPGLVTAGTCKS